MTVSIATPDGRWRRSWQAEGSWVLTGEKTGFNGVKPRSPVDPRLKSWGAWELVARYVVKSTLIIVPPSHVAVAFVDLVRKGELQTHVYVSGQRVVTQSDWYRIDGCPGPPPNPPCVTATWAMPAVRVFAGGDPVLLRDSRATCKTPRTDEGEREHCSSRW